MSISQDWSDLVEYVIHKFINNKPSTTPLQCLPLVEGSNIVEAQAASPLVSVPNNSKQSVWSQEEIDTLYWHYVQSKNAKDPIGYIVKRFNEGESKSKPRIEVIKQLLHQDIITLIEFDDLMKIEDINYVHANRSNAIGTDECGSSGHELKPSDDIQVTSPTKNIKNFADTLQQYFNL